MKDTEWYEVVLCIIVALLCAAALSLAISKPVDGHYATTDGDVHYQWIKD